MMQEEATRTNFGGYYPGCSTSGDFEPQQCNGSTGYCWCVNQYGLELEGTRRGPTEKRVVCSDSTPAPDRKGLCYIDRCLFNNSTLLLTQATLFSVEIHVV